MSKTKKPKGLAIAINGLAFTGSWKIADSNYGNGQQLQYRTKGATKWRSWHSVSIGKTATSKKFLTLSQSDYYPYSGKTKKVTAVEFKVRGNKSGSAGWSDWESKSVTLKAPPAPTVTATLSSANQTTFAWALQATTVSRPFYDCQWQTILVKDSTVTDGSKLTWDSSAMGYNSGTGNASGSRAITDDFVTNSYTRWFRVRTRGIAGASDWKYAKHVYAKPYTAVIKSASATVSGTVTTLNVKWQADAKASRPIDSTTVQYTIATPATGLTVPAGASPTDIVSSIDTKGTDAWAGEVPAVPSTDEAMWVRVVTTHDAKASYSAWKLVKTGKLAAPGTPSATFGAQAIINATNNSSVPDSQLAVVYKSSKTKEFVLGIIPHGSSSVTVAYPSETDAEQIIGVYAFQGTYTQKTRNDGVNSYAITANMKSDTVWMTNTLPKAPTNVTVDLTETPGEVMLTWNWAWTAADVAELSWSTNPYAWESTDSPETYQLDNSHAAHWRISGLETGTTWYFRVRLGLQSEDKMTWSGYSDLVDLDLSSAPAVPYLILSKDIVTQDEELTASWVYSTTDGTSQAYAEICTITDSGGTITYGDIIARTAGAQRVNIDTSDWTAGTTYSLCVRVKSQSGMTSEWSDPTDVTLAEPLSCSITATSLQNVTLTDAGGETRTVLSLTAMPLTATVTGAGTSGITRLVIERAADYQMDRPDESTKSGYEGETVLIYTQDGEDQITVDQEDLIGVLDDGAQYRLIATVQDGLGQSASESIEFEVHWSHQAIEPLGTVTVDSTNLIARITPTKPTGWTAGDVCDIYRLSVDRPELIVEGGEFGVEYVDPYPSLGDAGGHRIVYKTINGDYITAENKIAWLDLPSVLDYAKTIIDFDGDRVELEYNMSVGHSWDKDFTETTYLGGSIQGDWNPAVHRSAKVDAVLIYPRDAETIEAMRRLSTYAGICHVRTVDGSSFAADVQVSEDRSHDKAGKIVSFSLAITRVDTEDLDGLTYAEWVVS